MCVFAEDTRQESVGEKSKGKYSDSQAPLETPEGWKEGPEGSSELSGCLCTGAVTTSTFFVQSTHRASSITMELRAHSLDSDCLSLRLAEDLGEIDSCLLHLRLLTCKMRVIIIPTIWGHWEGSAKQDLSSA